MFRYARTLIFASALILAIGLVTRGAAVRADDEDEKAIKAAQKDVLDLAKMVEGGKEGKAIVAKMKKQYEELNTIMQVYKPRAKKGIGVGPKSAGDGIEAKLLSLGKRAPTAAVLDKQKGELTKMAYINLAMAEVVAAYVPSKLKAGKGAKEWMQYSADMKKSSQELLDAIKSGDPAKVKTAANNVNNACNNCHSDFRDS